MKKLFLIGALLFMGLSCADDIDDSGNVNTNRAPLVITVSNRLTTKGLLRGIYMPEGAELAVLLRASDGTRYDASTINNFKYTAVGEEASQTWEVKKGEPIGLSNTIGTAYAFYPWSSADFSDLTVPITNDGTDYMYADAPAENLSVSNSRASFRMKHAMTVIRCRIVKGDYPRDGKITTVGVTSDGLATSAKMDLPNATIIEHQGVGTEIQAKNIGNMSSTPLETALWGIATNTTGVLNFRVVADGDVYLASTPELTLQPGVIYTYTITVNALSMTVSKASIEHWDYIPAESLTPDVV